MRSNARGGARGAKKTTPQDMIKTLENNIKEMNERHNVDLQEM